LLPLRSLDLKHNVGAHWKVFLHVGMLVNFIVAVHSLYMREYWVTIKQTPMVYPYIDWSLIVPLQMIEFYCILKAVKPELSAGLFWRAGTVVMLVFDYLGERNIVNQMIEFYCILEAVKPEFGAGFLLVVIMFAFDYLGEQNIVNPWIGFAIRMAGWG